MRGSNCLMMTFSSHQALECSFKMFWNLLADRSEVDSFCLCSFPTERAQAGIVTSKYLSSVLCNVIIMIPKPWGVVRSK